MSFMIAVIGGCGVGKTVLLEQFVKIGLKAYDLTSLVTDFIICSDYANEMSDQLLLLNKKYHLLSEHEVMPRLLEDPLLYEHLHDFLDACYDQKKASDRVVVEIPSILMLDQVFKGAVQIFDHVIAVDCDNELQVKYLVQAHHLSINQARTVAGIGVNRTEYLNYATDIFLNTVKHDYLNWVAVKLLDSYQASDALYHT